MAREDSQSQSKKRSMEDEACSLSKKTIKRAKKNPAKRECLTCLQDVAIDQFPGRAHAKQEHDDGICSTCWTNHLQSEVDIKTSDTVACAQCTFKLDNDDIKKLASTKTYQRWLDKSRDRTTDADSEGFRCPSASCQFRCLIFDGNIFTCPWCNLRHCVDCDAPMHDGEFCAAYQERKQADEARRARENEESELKVEAISKKCPACGARLRKAGGCDHFTCGVCSHQFCWQCSAPYRGEDGILGSKGNHAHQQSCLHHPRRLPSYSPHAHVTVEDSSSDDDSSSDGDSDSDDGD